jgi:1-phosphofructokinase family hexose kinase
MILVVALNPALDVTHHVTRVDWAGVNRAVEVRARPGGKGLNVARILRLLGADVLVIGLAGGLTGAAVKSAVSEAGVAAEFTPIAGETRRTFAVVDTHRSEVAVFTEPGPGVSADEFATFSVLYKNSLNGCAALVLSGSLPPGVPTDSYASLIRVAAAAGVPTLLDAHGDPLWRGTAAGPGLVKPNLAELGATVGRRLRTAGGPDQAAVVGAARELRAAGAGAVVVSLGADGLLAVTGDGTWHAAPPGRLTGNPTGAGDAVAAGLAHSLVLGRPWPERLRHAVALGTAAVAAPAAGEFTPAHYDQMLPGVRVAACEDR